MLSFLDPGFSTDPFPTWEALRARDPVLWLDEIDGWVLTGHAAVREGLRHPSLSPSVRFWRHHEPPPVDAASTPRGRFDSSGLFAAAPADHVRLRRLINRAFTVRGVQAQQDFTATLAADLLRPWSKGDEIDLMDDYFGQIPARVIANLVGFPSESASEFRALADTLSLTLEPIVDDETEHRIDEAIVTLEAMITDLAAERRRHPGDDLLTRMLEVEDEGDRLTFEELVALVLGLVIAGSGTTANFMGAAATLLLDHPETLRRLHAEPDAMAPAVEELLRRTCFGYGMPHFAVEDLELLGHPVRAGDLVLCVMSAGNTDPSVFPDPMRLDIDRDTSEIVTFSIGAHYCLGAALARLEANVVLGELISRFGDSMRLAGEPKLESTYLFLNVLHLPVVL